MFPATNRYLGLLVETLTFVIINIFVNLFNGCEQVNMFKIVVCILLLQSAVMAQDCPTKNCAEELIMKRSLKAISITGKPPVIDGKLDEGIWQQAPVADRFVETRPQPGTAAQLKTEVGVLYDDAAIYIGMRMYQKPEMILGPFVRRDDEINCDWAFVEFDSHHDYRSGFSFGLNPVGVQADGAWLKDTDYDGSWDGVWKGASSIDSQGWSAFGFIFSNATNLGFDEDLANGFVRNAFAGGIDGRTRFHSSEYEIGGWFLTSFLNGDQVAIRKVTEEPHHFFQRPDADYLHDLGTDGSLFGYAAQSRLSRIAGRMQWNLIGEVISPGYDTNEIGFQRNSDWFLLAGNWKYEVFQSGHLIRHWAIGSDRLGLGWNFAGELRAQTINGFVQLDARNYWKFNARWLHDFSSLFVEWLRGGPALLLPKCDLFQYSILTDQRRASYAQLDGSWWQESGSDSNSWMLNPQIYITNGLHLRWSFGLSYQEDQIGWQYVTNANNDYVVARDHQKTISPTLRADWAFSPHLILQFYAQPFVRTGKFDRYQLLVDPRARENQNRFVLLDDNQISDFIFLSG
jgi:hypothetical protein